MEEQANYIQRIEIHRLWDRFNSSLGFASRCEYPFRYQWSREDYDP